MSDLSRELVQADIDQAERLNEQTWFEYLAEAYVNGDLLTKEEAMRYAYENADFNKAQRFLDEQRRLRRPPPKVPFVLAVALGITDE